MKKSNGSCKSCLTNKMTETPFFFSNGSHKLFGILHEPENRFNGTGFVFCSPFAEEKLWTHMVFVNFARELAQIGYPVLRFDYMGHGDSEGDFEDSTVETRLSDIKSAIQALKTKVSLVEKVDLLGLRLGATLAALTAEKEPDISHLILWEPIINGSSYMQELLRVNLSTQSAIYKEIRHNRQALIQIMKEGGTVNVDGYEIAWPLYEQTVGIDFLDRKKTHPGRALLVQISKKKGNMNNKLDKLRSLYDHCELGIAVEEPFWKEIRFFYPKAKNLFRITLDWLEDK